MTAIRHILFPYDCSPRGAEVVPYVRALATRFDARITILGVVPPVFDAISPESSHLRVGEDMAAWKRHLQCELDQAFRSELAGVVVDRIADAGDPALRIVDFAHKHAVDLIVMPTHGAGPFRSMLIGSVSAKVLHDARCPVWTAAHAEVQRAAPVPRLVLCALDGSARTPALIQWASDFADAHEARLSLLHVVGPVSDWPTLESERRLQEQVRQTARTKLDGLLSASGFSFPLNVAVGQVVSTIVEEAKQAAADLIVIGRGVMPEPFGRLRTHAFGIIQQSPCPVLSV